MRQPFIFLFILGIFRGIVVHCQQYPPCLNELISKTAEQHKKNPCERSDKLLRVEQYSYKDTLLYKLIFERKTFCPDYISNTVFYDADCKVKIQIRDGGLKYRHEVLPSWVNDKEIKFIKTIDQVKENKRQSNAGDLTNPSIDKKGNELKKFYLSLNVEKLWIAGSHINWETGVADKPDAAAGNHTHCSAFVAAACKQMDIYILRPPEHGQILLANAQCGWLQTKDAQKKGWSPVTNFDRLSLYIQVQKLANTGNVVVAVIKSQDATKPGHAALIMPKNIEEDELRKDGPILIMAGTHNFNFISLKNGFKSHITGWPENEILFFVNRNKSFQIPER